MWDDVVAGEGDGVSKNQNNKAPLWIVKHFIGEIFGGQALARYTEDADENFRMKAEDLPPSFFRDEDVATWKDGVLRRLYAEIKENKNYLATGKAFAFFVDSELFTLKDSNGYPCDIWDSHKALIVAELEKDGWAINIPRVRPALGQGRGWIEIGKK